MHAQIPDGATHGHATNSDIIAFSIATQQFHPDACVQSSLTTLKPLDLKLHNLNSHPSFPHFPSQV